MDYTTNNVNINNIVDSNDSERLQIQQKCMDLYIHIKQELIKLGFDGYWILIINGEVVHITKNKKTIKLPTGDFYLVQIGYEDEPIYIY